MIATDRPCPDPSPLPTAAPAVAVQMEPCPHCGGAFVGGACLRWAEMRKRHGQWIKARLGVSS